MNIEPLNKDPELFQPDKIPVFIIVIHNPFLHWTIVNVLN